MFFDGRAFTESFYNSWQWLLQVLLAGISDGDVFFMQANQIKNLLKTRRVMAELKGCYFDMTD